MLVAVIGAERAHPYNRIALSRYLVGDLDEHALDGTALKVAGAGQYRRPLVRDDRLVGAMLYNEAADAPWYLRLIKQRQPIGAARAALPFSPAFAPAEWTA